MNTLRTFLTGAALVSALVAGNAAFSGGDSVPATSAIAAETPQRSDATGSQKEADLKVIQEFFKKEGKAEATPAASPRSVAQETPSQLASSSGQVVNDLSPDEVKSLQDFFGRDRITQDADGRVLLDGKAADLGALMAAVQREHQRQLDRHVTDLTARHQRLAEISRTLDRLKRETNQLFAENTEADARFQMMMAKRQKALEILSGVVTKDLKKLDALLSSVR